MSALSAFVSARVDELGRAVPDPAEPGAAGPPEVGRWRELVEEHGSAVPLTERWVRLELALREVAGLFSSHPDFDARWLVPVQVPRPGRPAAQRGVLR